MFGLLQLQEVNLRHDLLIMVTRGRELIIRACSSPNKKRCLALLGLLIGCDSSGWEEGNSADLDGKAPALAWG